MLFARARSKYMIVVGQEIIYDIRKDLFEHLQKLPFQFYDDRPHGKILTRVINYVNSVSDALSNGIINFVLEIFNLILIAVFMFLCDVRLSLIVMAGIPLFLVIVLLIKPAQRRAWQDVSNKSSNINAYLHESLDGMKITQAFTREEENRGIYEKLNKKCYQTWMKAQYTSNLVWYSVDNISNINLLPPVSLRHVKMLPVPSHTTGQSPTTGCCRILFGKIGFDTPVIGFAIRFAKKRKPVCD